MSQENNGFESKDVPVINEQQTKSPEELEAKFGLPKVFGSLALAAAALGGGMQNAEAGGARMYEVNSPQVNQLKAELSSLGVHDFKVIQSMATNISTERGNISLTRDENSNGVEDSVNKALNGVNGHQFLKEIERQNSRLSKIQDSIDTAHGMFNISISPYAQEVLKGNGITYQNGILSNSKHRINMSGGSDPNTECKITGWKEFKNFVIADCMEINMASGKPVISSIKYQINPDLSLVEIKK